MSSYPEIYDQTWTTGDYIRQLKDTITRLQMEVAELEAREAAKKVEMNFKNEPIADDGNTIFSPRHAFVSYDQKSVGAEPNGTNGNG